MYFFKTASFIILFGVLLVGFPFGTLAQEESNVLQRQPVVNAGEEASGEDLMDDTEDVIDQIVITGNDKIEADAILAQIQSKVGDIYSLEQVRQDVLRLYRLGYFYNIEVDKTDQVLTYKVTEKPTVTKITFEGNDALDDDDLKEALDMKPYEFLNISSIRLAVEKLEKLYEEKGFFLASLDYELKDLKNNSAELIFYVQENDKVKVKDITILGNENVSDEELTSAMLTKEQGFFSFLSGSGQYRQEFFERDMQILKVVYYNKGYIRAEIGLPRVYISPDRKSISIRISIEEGERYKIGNVGVEHDQMFSTQELLDIVKIKDSEYFAYNIVQEDLGSLQAMYGDLGYAYTNVTPQTQIREQDKTVDILYEIDKGEKATFGQFSITGNTKTRDKVIRRELKIKEGQTYHETHKRESLANVKRLGFFEDVTFHQTINPNQPNVIDIEIRVKERSTDSLNASLGYGGYSGLFVNAMLRSHNLLGRGQSLSFSATNNNVLTSGIGAGGFDYSLQFTEPYFMDTLWSTGVELYHTKLFIFEDDYSEVRTGGALRFGYPLAEYLRGFLSYKFYNVNIIPGRDFDETVFNESSAEGKRGAVAVSLEYDKRDDRFNPKNGVYLSSSLEYTGLGGSKKYMEGSLNARFYKEIFWNIVFRNNLMYSLLMSPEGHAIPFNEYFRLGGLDTLRGFDWFRIGRTVRSRKLRTVTENGVERQLPFRDVVVGGTQQFYYNMEFQFPIFSKLLGVVFLDTGYADNRFRLENFRTNVGFGFRVWTPFAPIRIEWGIPINRKENERRMEFQFGMGTMVPF